VVSWNDALAFCRWLSAQTGRSIRLPTEAEWEYAARAGGREDSAGGPEEAAWYEGNAGDGAHPVGTRRPNPWGLVDMQGNAWEWCLDVWHPNYCAAAPEGRAQMCDPVVPEVVWRYVLRGGSWFTPTRQLSLTYRARHRNDFSRPDIGFRIVVAPATGDAIFTAPLRGDTGRHGSCVHDAQKARTILEAHGARFEFVRVRAGEFLMGGTDGIEKPVHKVRIGYDFEMGTTEVTVGQFRAFLQATGYSTDSEKVGVSWTRGPDTDWQSEDAVPWCTATRDQSDEHPAIFISWYDAMAFCHWLSRETGQEIRLPSEAEWEHACRAGTTGLYAGELSEMGWYNYNSCNRTHPVAQKQPNAWGLHDMHGNVWEWCLDFFQLNYEGAPADGRPHWEVQRTSDVVSRGGSFRNPPGWLASSCRMGSTLDCSNGNNGFRLVRALKDSANDGPAVGTAASRTPAPVEANVATLVPVTTEFPKRVFIGTPADLRAPRIKPVQQEAGPPFLAPAGTKNVALGKPVSASDPEPIIGELEMITDGDKEAAEGSYVVLGPLLQHVTIDLQAPHEIYGVRVWHYHQQPRVYFDVIVQIADDRDFTVGVATIFNNDMDNSAGLGVGTDRHYVDTHFGELFDARDARSRFVRLYSCGNTNDDQNHYIEVEVYGRPAGQ
jgi:formylglycine-generating enzyme required for sulfatase activity